MDRHYIVLAALDALVADGKLERGKLEEAFKRYQIDRDTLNPLRA